MTTPEETGGINEGTLPDASPGDAGLTPPQAPSSEGAAEAPATEPKSSSDTEEKQEADDDSPPVDNNPRTNPNVLIVRQIVEAKKNLRNVYGYLDLFLRPNPAYFDMREKFSDPEAMVKDQKGADWMMSAVSAEENILDSNIFGDSLRREGGDWSQFVEYEGARLSPAMPELGGGGKKLTGEKAAMKLQGMMGLGATVQIPLWHSGLWLSILAPQESELLMLDQVIAEEKIEVGSKTGGLAFSNESVYINHHLINFALNRIYQTTINNTSPEVLKQNIRLLDLYGMAAGLALTIYPQGYMLRVPCVADPTKCQHVTEAHIHLARTFLVDRSKLTNEQKKHMANRKASYTVEQIQDYQRKGMLADGRTIAINDQLQIVLKSPTLEEHIQSGFAWIEGMQATIEKALGPSVTLKEKNTFISQQAILTNLRQYAHWVEKVIYEDVEYEGAESIDPILSMMSSDGEVAEAFFNGIKKFIDDSAVAMIGAPTFPCPACGTPLTSAESQNPDIIPLDPIKLFFVLMGHRIIRAKMLQTNS